MKDGDIKLQAKKGAAYSHTLAIKPMAYSGGFSGM
jgi:hypothetical protein